MPFAARHAVAHDCDHEVVLGIAERDRRLVPAVTERAARRVPAGRVPVDGETETPVDLDAVRLVEHPGAVPGGDRGDRRHGSRIARRPARIACSAASARYAEWTARQIKRRARLLACSSRQACAASRMPAFVIENHVINVSVVMATPVVEGLRPDARSARTEPVHGRRAARRCASRRRCPVRARRPRGCERPHDSPTVRRAQPRVGFTRSRGPETTMATTTTPPAGAARRPPREEVPARPSRPRLRAAAAPRPRRSGRGRRRGSCRCASTDRRSARSG